MEVGTNAPDREEGFPPRGTRSLSSATSHILIGFWWTEPGPRTLRLVASQPIAWFALSGEFRGQGENVHLPDLAYC